MRDGTELEIGPGGVFEIPPGHDAWVVGDEPWVSVDFEAMRAYGRVEPASGRRSLFSRALWRLRFDCRACVVQRLPG